VTPPEATLVDGIFRARRKGNMRRIIRLFITALVLASAPLLTVAQQPAPQQQTETKSQTVYVTRTGKKYHRDGCRYLRSSRIPVSLKDAKDRGYTPCSVCKPPR
jgi:hypothetical protein